MKISGAGTQLSALKKMAGPNIEFLGRLSDEELAQAYSKAKAFVFAADEDAGITLLEAQASGIPVVAYKKGGALEAVIEGVTGEFFEQQTEESLVEKLKNFDVAKYDRLVIRSNAEKYSQQNFQKLIKEFVLEKYENRT